MILYVISDYRSASVSYKAGDVIEISPDKAEFLLRDSPGSFSLDKPVPDPEPVVDAPPKDKRVKRSSTNRKSKSK